MKKINKFRAWDNKKKSMLPPPVLNYDTVGVSDDGELFVGINDDNGDWQELKLMQFTGIKDKNNKEIYENDIVKCSGIYHKKYVEHIGNVVFESGAFIIGSATMPDSYMTFIDLRDDWDIEVIGNTYKMRINK